MIILPLFLFQVKLSTLRDHFEALSLEVGASVERFP